MQSTSSLSQPIRPERLPNELSVPWPGQPWPGIEGAIYAGLCPGELGAEPYHLVLLQPEPTGRLNWAAGMEWARALGADLPTRNESALLYAFHRHLFDEDAWYWTGTQYSSSDAWLQYFYDGGQLIIDKEFEARCRAVRRFFNAQSFNTSDAPAAEEAEA